MARSKSTLLKLPRNIYILGFLSFFNDLSSGMITPLLPVFLSSLGLGASFLGLMEGLANALSHGVVLLSGWYADRYNQDRKLTLFGYILCSVVRFFMAIPVAGVVLGARLSDRIGKGIRTAPRDRLLTASLTQEDWGKGFGVQRAMDHAGDFLAWPLSAALLAWTALSLSGFFVVASIPAFIMVLVLARYLREARLEKSQQETSPKLSLSLKSLPKPLKRYLIIIFISAFSTPSELFLILKIKNLGLAAHSIPWVWGTLTLASLLASLLGGYLADHWSQRRTIALGWLLFALGFVGFAFTQHIAATWALIGLHGFQLGLVEASERSYPAHWVAPQFRGVAMGWYYFAYSLGLLPASWIFGLIWEKIGSSQAFLIYAGMSLLAIPFLFLLPSHRNKTEKNPS